MPNVFHPVMNTVSRVSIFGAVFFVALLIALLWFLVRTPYVTEANVIREQPIPFSHQHHVSDVGIDCRYCHNSVEVSSFAGLPATSLCLNCHTYLFSDQPMLAPLRDSFRSEKPIEWTRVHDLADYVQFNHSIHLHKGIGCIECHGQVDQMPLMWRQGSLLMEWCLDCHRHPAEHVRPREFNFHMQSLEELSSTEEFQEYLAEEFPDLDPRDPDLFRLRAELVEKYEIESVINCSYCHY